MDAAAERTSTLTTTRRGRAPQPCGACRRIFCGFRLAGRVAMVSFQASLSAAQYGAKDRRTRVLYSTERRAHPFRRPDLHLETRRLPANVRKVITLTTNW